MRHRRALRIVGWIAASILGLPTLALASVYTIHIVDDFAFLGTNRPVEWGVVGRLEVCFFPESSDEEWVVDGYSVPPHETRIYQLETPFEDAFQSIGDELESRGYELKTPFVLQDGTTVPFRIWQKHGSQVVLNPGRADSFKDLLRDRVYDTDTWVTVWIDTDLPDDWVTAIRRSFVELRDY